MRRENPVQSRLCNAKNAVFKRLETGYSLRSRSSPANSNAVSFTYIWRPPVVSYPRHLPGVCVLLFQRWEVCSPRRTRGKWLFFSSSFKSRHKLSHQYQLWHQIKVLSEFRHSKTLFLSVHDRINNCLPIYLSVWCLSVYDMMEISRYHLCARRQYENQEIGKKTFLLLLNFWL